MYEEYKIEELIIKHLDNSSTPYEEEVLSSWLNESVENKRTYSEVSDLWNLSQIQLGGNKETEEALKRFKSRVRIPFVDKQPVQQRKRKIPLLYQLTQIAALLLIVINVGYLLLSTSQESTVVTNRLLTAENSKGRFVLPDSTIVWLNANSVLEYPENFAFDKREIRLKGEGYFEVRQNKSSPFIIDAGDVSVQVLGTSFLLQNYENKPYIETVLTEGSILLSGQSFDDMIIVPNQRVSYLKGEKKVLVEDVQTSNYTSWIKDSIEFDNTSLANIIVNLEKWYGVEIQCDESLSKSVNLSFTLYRESLDEILFALEQIAPIKYMIRENEITLMKK